nr:FHA domain-containing protein [uncultured Desulfobacter sp.]
MKQALNIIVQLVHIHGPMKGEIQEFACHEITIGRHPSCDLQFPKDQVAISRNHAQITRDGNRFKIEDTSTNGTFVNGTKITEAWLKNGDVIFFTDGGPKVSFLTREGRPDEVHDLPAQDPDIVPPSPVHEPPRKVVHEMPPLPLPDSGMPPAPSGYSHPVGQNSARVPERPGNAPPVSPSPPEPPAYAPPAPGAVNQWQSPPPLKVETVNVPLVVQYGPILQSFNQLPVTIGCHPGCDLVLQHPGLMDQHVQIFFANGSYQIKNLTGHNRITVNEQPVTTVSAVKPGDRVFLSADGPGFQFIEGGRMAEINMPSQVDTSDQEDAFEPESGSSEKKKPFFLKRLWR